MSEVAAPGSGPPGPPAGYGTHGAGDARILDQGYRRYDGPRRGVAGAVRAVHKAAAQRALGLKRSARFKVVPFLVAVMSYLPAVVFVGAAALLPDAFEDELPFDYADYYGYITAAIVLFVSFVTPEILCTDRRTGMLGLYLSGPLDRTRYLLAKGAAIATVLAVVTLGPPLLLLIGFTLADSGPDGLLDTLQTAARIVGSAAIVTLWYTALSMAVSSLTDRRAFASAGIILTVLVSSAVTNSLVEAELSPQLLLADLFTLPFELVRRVYGVRGEGQLDELATTSLCGAGLAFVAVFLVIVAGRYRRLSVTR
jgi:ABC-2 type transport system permease protein